MPIKATWNIRQHLEPGQVIIQSHRGAGELAPENTTEAFQLGWKLKTYPEADVRTTTDGVIVAFHDENFDRVVKDLPPDLKGKGVKDVTWEELQKLDVGAWRGEGFVGRRVSRLSDVFSLMKGKPDRHLYLDIKNVDLEQLAELVKKYDVQKQVVLASPKHSTIIQWKEYVPESDTLLWMGTTQAEVEKKFAAAQKRDFEGITQLQVHTHLPAGTKQIERNAVNPFTISDAFLVEAGKELRKHHILYQTLPYGGNSKEIYWKLLDLGFMSFATDYPKKTKAAIEEYYKLNKKSSH
jgi:glycerophosphoryl diester phosphodiesterase